MVQRVRIRCTRPRPIGRVKNFAFLNLDDESEAVEQGWLKSIQDIHLWGYLTSDKRYEFLLGNKSHRSAMIPAVGHFFMYIQYKGKVMCLVIQGSTFYLVGFIVTSVGDKLKIREMSKAHGDATMYIEGGKKMNWFGNYKWPASIQVGDGALKSAFRVIYSRVSGEGRFPTDTQVYAACDIFVLHFPEAARYDSLLLCNIKSRFLLGGRVGVYQSDKIHNWSKDSRDALALVTVEEPVEEPPQNKGKQGKKLKKKRSVAAY